MMGLYPPKKSGAPKLTEGMVKSFEDGTALPPFKVRGAEQVNSQLGFAALPNSFNAIDILVFDDPETADDSGWDGCPWIDEVISPRTDDESIWQKYEYMRADTREAVKASLNLTDSQCDDVNFHDYYHYTDAIVAIEFEGSLQLREEYFTDDLWLEMNELQRVYLTDWFTPDTRALLNSRELRKPMEIMQLKVDAELGIKKHDTDLKYFIFSSHDTQVDNMVVWLTQNKTYFDYTPYASQVMFELNYSEKCIEETPSENCFGVDVIYNGETLDLCSGSSCTYPAFKEYMASIWYSGPHADDLDAACFQPYNP